MPAYRSVFISHAHVDNAICAQFADALRRRAIDVWIDLNNAQAGHDLTDAIDQELTRRTAFVLMVTSASNASHWVRQERSAYNALINSSTRRVVNGVERMILPVRINDEVPTILGGLLWIDAMHKTVEQTADAITHAISINRVADAATVASPPPTYAPHSPPTGIPQASGYVFCEIVFREGKQWESASWAAVSMGTPALQVIDQQNVGLRENFNVGYNKGQPPPAENSPSLDRLRARLRNGGWEEIERGPQPFNFRYRRRTW